MARVNLAALIKYANEKGLDWHDVDMEMFTDHSKDAEEMAEKLAKKAAQEKADRAELRELIEKLPHNKVRALNAYLSIYIYKGGGISFDDFWYGADDE